MATRFTFRDVTYLVAIAFTLGCCVLIVNSALIFLPYMLGLTLPNSVIYVEGGLSVLSCCLFLVGSTFAYIEAVNDNRRGCFGWKIEPGPYGESTESVVEKGPGTHWVPDEESCTHHHTSRTNLVEPQRESTDGASEDQTTEDQTSEDQTSEDQTSEAQPQLQAISDDQPWRLFPSYQEFRYHYAFELGFMANALFVCSSFIFSCCSVCALSTIIISNEIARWIRYPQLVAGTGFFIASTMLMLECQKVWWKPAIATLGWHINLWNIIGSAGFIFCAVFGLVEDNYWAQFQFGCSFLWGSWAFLFGSIVQWYESLDKYPVKKLKEKVKTEVKGEEE